MEVTSKSHGYELDTGKYATAHVQICHLICKNPEQLHNPKYSVQSIIKQLYDKFGIKKFDYT